MPKKVCDFCLKEGGKLIHRLTKTNDNHYICSNCKKILNTYHLPLKYDLFQMLLTAQNHMKNMMMDAYLDNHDPTDCLAKYYPYPPILMHQGEHCINIFPATQTVLTKDIPTTNAVTQISDITKEHIVNLEDNYTRNESTTINGTLILTEVALYFLSEHYINCHRTVFIQHESNSLNQIVVKQPNGTFTYTVEHADLFLLRERFFHKIIAAQNNKLKKLIYITNDEQFTITPGIYDVPRHLKPGKYSFKSINGLGLHIRDNLGRIKDYYEDQSTIDIDDGGVLECTGEYELQWLSKEK